MKDDVIHDVLNFVELLQMLNLNVVRHKIECVIYDKVVEST